MSSSSFRHPVHDTLHEPIHAPQIVGRAIVVRNDLILIITYAKVPTYLTRFADDLRIEIHFPTGRAFFSPVYCLKDCCQARHIASSANMRSQHMTNGQLAALRSAR